MTGRSPLSATEGQRAAVTVLAGSRDCREADRARAVLLTLTGWTSPRIAEAFGVRDDRVRLWRSDFMGSGVDALKASVAPGPAPVKSEAPLRVVTPLLEQPVADRRNWTIPRMRAEIEAREGIRISRLQLSMALRKKFRWRRPRHTLKGREVAGEVERVGLRLQLRKQPAEAGDIILLYGDESETLTHPYLARAWARVGTDLRVPAQGQAKKIAMLGSLDHVKRELIVHTSPTKRSSDFVAHREQLDRRFGPKPGQPAKPVVLVEDNGPIHTSKLSLAALGARAHWLTIEWLPKYAPELNDIEVVWHDLKAHHLAHQTFADPEALDWAIHQAVSELNVERMALPLDQSRISAYTSPGNG
jgi:transposase